MNIALKNASHKGYLNVVRFLSENGTDDFLNAFKFAHREGHINTLEYFLEEGSVNPDDLIEYGVDIELFYEETVEEGTFEMENFVSELMNSKS